MPRLAFGVIIEVHFAHSSQTIVVANILLCGMAGDGLYCFMVSLLLTLACSLFENDVQPTFLYTYQQISYIYIRNTQRLSLIHI